MPRGGARPGAGRKAGRKNRRKLQLEVEAKNEGRTLTPAQKHAALKRQVALCVADNMEADEIAAVLEIPADRLRALFSRELRHGRAIIRAEMLARLEAQSAEGNVAAGKAVLAAADGEGAPGKTVDGHAPGSVAERALRLIEGGRS